MAESQRQQIATALRYIDESRRALESQQNPDNREIVRELRASADRIFDVLNDLEEIDGDEIPDGMFSKESRKE